MESEPFQRIPKGAGPLSHVPIYPPCHSSGAQQSLHWSTSPHTANLNLAADQGAPSQHKVCQTPGPVPGRSCKDTAGSRERMEQFTAARRKKLAAASKIHSCGSGYQDVTEIEKSEQSWNPCTSWLQQFHSPFMPHFAPVHHFFS